jgi:hypothetical protein
LKFSRGETGSESSLSVMNKEELDQLADETIVSSQRGEIDHVVELLLT